MAVAIINQTFTPQNQQDAFEYNDLLALGEASATNVDLLIRNIAEYNADEVHVIRGIPLIEWAKQQAHLHDRWEDYFLDIIESGGRNTPDWVLPTTHGIVVWDDRGY